MSAKKEPNGAGSTLEALKNSVRMLRIRWLQARNGDYMVICTFAATLLVCGLLVQFLFSLGTSLVAPSVASGAKAEVSVPLSRCKGTSFGLGEGTSKARSNLKRLKISVVKIPFYSKKMEMKLKSALVQIESEANSGWNKTGATVLPLGDFGYVRR